MLSYSIRRSQISEDVVVGEALEIPNEMDGGEKFAGTGAHSRLVELNGSSSEYQVCPAEL